MNIYHFAFESELTTEYGRLTFGAEPLRKVGEDASESFAVYDTVFNGEAWVVLGLKRAKNEAPSVWRTTTKDGIHFEEAVLLFTLPKRKRPWLAGDVAIRGDQGLVLICECGSPPEAGHSFFAFGGALDGTGWAQLSDQEIYHGQDAFGLVWDGTRFINYQTSYQPYKKRFPDNMGPNVRRVLHIRTSPDGLTWTPGDSFGAHGPYLPDSMLMPPDEKYPEETEFYKFRAFQLDGVWSGVMTKYISQPQELPKAGPFPHGPLSGQEWWVSRDGIHWDKNMRETSALDGIPFRILYYMGVPFPVGDELRWKDSKETWAVDRSRRFYASCRSNASILVPAQAFGKTTPRVQLAFPGFTRDTDPKMQQGYFMAEMVDSNGKVIPGFEREKCTHLASEARHIDLSWTGRSPDLGDLPANARLRLLFRDVRIHSLTW